ncbi:MAG: sel1 repeat family protein [Magnetococcales bacterium]|nr:sel1 repeat family protein [Magnetococcales bacterium]
MAQQLQIQRRTRLYNTLAAVLLGWAVAASPQMAGAVDIEQAYKLGKESYQRNDWISAITHLRTAAEAQHVPSMLLLAYVLDRAEEDAEGMEWYRKAAMLNSAEGALGLGEMLAETPEGKKNPAEALEWISRAAKLNHPPAMMLLGQFHLLGSMGVKADTQEAKKWLELAAKEGFAPAVRELEKLRAPAPGKEVDGTGKANAKKGASEAAGPQQEVESMIDRWAKACAEQDMAALRTLYIAGAKLPTFNPGERTAALNLRDVRVILLEDTKARAMFSQSLTNDHKNPVHKALTLHKEAGAWKVVQEERLP